MLCCCFFLFNYIIQPMKTKVILIVLFFLVSFISVLKAQYEYPFRNPELSIDLRIDNILSLMTLEEKINCLGTNPSVPRLDIKGTGHVEGLHGVAQGGPGNWAGRGLKPQPTTMFPQSIGLAQSWDKEVLKTVGSVEGYEVRYLFQSLRHQRGGMVVRSPNADLGRDPRWGRNEECYGEDAFLNGALVVAFIKGLQGDHPKYWQAASLMKHFLANSNENGRDSSSSNFDERLWREYYSYPFWKGVVEGGSRAYMAAYNAYNGIPCTVHPFIKEITIDEWGQNGILCTDGGAYRMLVNSHHYYPDLYKAAAGCLNAGINQFLDRYQDGIKGALERNYISETTIDSALRGNFRVIIKLGLLDPPERVPYSQIGIKDTLDPWLSDQNKKTARQVTQKTIVLLKNSKKLLPLNKNRLKTVAVIGERANEVLLDWYSGSLSYAVSALEGIKKKLGNNVRVIYAATNNGDSAVIAAKNADVAIVCVGNMPVGGDNTWKKVLKDSYGKEAVDRKTINLEDEELVKKVYKANKNTVAVLISSFPYAINWTQDNVPAIVQMAHCSQEQGNALADVLFGDYNPGGKLVQTWPASISQLPDMMDYDIRKGRTYMYFKGKPLYPFGYGLSYTTFAFSNMKTSSDYLNANDEMMVTIDITNTGKVVGDEVAQLYVTFLDSKVERPLKQLKGFERVTIQPGATKTVSIPLKAESLAYWDVQNQQWKVESAKIKLMMGNSSENVKQEKIITVKELRFLATISLH